MELKGVAYGRRGAYVIDPQEGAVRVGRGIIPDFYDDFVEMFKQGIDFVAREFATETDPERKDLLLKRVKNAVGILNKINGETVISPEGTHFTSYYSHDPLANFKVKYDPYQEGLHIRLIFAGDVSYNGRLVGVVPESISSGVFDLVRNTGG